MIKVGIFITRLSLVLTISLLTMIGLSHSAQAACGDEAGVQCRTEFDSIRAVVRSGDGFTAAGQLKGSSAPGVGLIRLTRTGEVSGNAVLLPLPGEIPAARVVSAEPRKLIALPNGDVVLLSQIALADSKQAAWAARIAPNGHVLWTRPLMDNANTVSIVFHSAYYDRDRLIIVGRRTNGTDETSRCETWSQSLVVTLAAANGQPIGPGQATFGEQTKGFTNRQVIYDIAPDTSAGSFLVTGFATRKFGDNECRDNVFFATLAPTKNRWALSQMNLIGNNVAKGEPKETKLANEDAFAIKAVGGGSYLVVGQGWDPSKKAPAALAYQIKAHPFSVNRLYEPYPPDGSDKTGGDRFRTIVQLAERGFFLLAGSVSTAAQAPNKAAWQIVSSDLKPISPLAVFNSPSSSDIYDAAVSADGNVLAVGRWVDEGRGVGWIGFLGRPAAAPKPPVPKPPVPVAAERRAPRSSLPRLSSLPITDGSRRLPGTALSDGAAYFERDLAAGSQVDLTFSIAESQVIKASVYPESGNVDLVISDVKNPKRPITFSNFKGPSATELLFVTLAPGDYRVSIIAQTSIPSLELRLARSPGIDPGLLAKLAQLSDEQRSQFVYALESAGYTPPGNPDIALGGETMRSFLAIEESATHEIAPTEISKYVAGQATGR